MDTLSNSGDGVRRWVVAWHASDETAFDSAQLLWLEGYKPSANVAGTGSVPDGRQEGAYGQLVSVSLCERWKRGLPCCVAWSSASKTGSAATEVRITWRSGGSSRRRGTPCTWRSTAVIAQRYGGESRGLRRMSASIQTQRSLATKAMHCHVHTPTVGDHSRLQ